MNGPGWIIFFGVLSLIAAGTSGCIGGSVPRDGIVIAATPEGMRAFGEMQNGLITNVRGNPDVKSAYWQQLETHEAETTKREIAPGFLSKLLGK